jgi:hypothetical protein
MRQKFFHLRDTTAHGTGVAALSAVVAPFAGKAIIRAERDDTAPEKVDAWRICGRRNARATLEHGPTDGTVADIKSKFEIGSRGNCLHFILGFGE